MPALGVSGLVTMSVIALISVAAVALAVFLGQQVLAARGGTPRMQLVAEAAWESARAYLDRMVRTVGAVCAAGFVLLLLLPGDGSIRIGRSLFFLVGALFSAAIGCLGTWLGGNAGVRVAAAAGERGGPAGGARIAMRAGGAVGMCVVGLGLLGVVLALLIYRSRASAVLEGFAAGAALLAVFWRVGGSVFAKAADVGADLVGAAKQGIRDDDVRNPVATVRAVADCLGGCAGMAADLFASFVVTLVAAVLLGAVALGEQGVVFPLIVAAIGLVAAAAVVWFARLRSGEDGLRAVSRGVYPAALAGAVASAVAALVYLPSSFAGLTDVSEELATHVADPRILAALAVLIGVVLAGGVVWVTGYFTAPTSMPTRHVTRMSLTGRATAALAGVGVGTESAVGAAGMIAAAICGLFLISGGSVTLSMFLLCLAGCGLGMTAGLAAALAAFGSVTGSARGVAAMSDEADARGTQVLSELDDVGRVTKAIAKGLATTTAVLAATALVGAYADAARRAVAALGSELVVSGTSQALVSYDVASPVTLAGVILGAAAVCWFSGLVADAVTRAAGAIALEVHRQLRELPGILTWQERPQFERVAEAGARGTLRELAGPGLLAAGAPIAAGFGLGFGPLAGFLVGAVAAGLLVATFLTTGAAKVLGDPARGAAGPAVTPLLTVMSLVSLLVAPSVVRLSVGPQADPGRRITIAIIIGGLVLGVVVLSRLWAAWVDRVGRLERETHPE
jgi:K(+)-stimulated pyrophosphate-energized sodium pump